MLDKIKNGVKDIPKVSMLIESVYVHKRDPKSGTQAIDITWKF